MVIYELIANIFILALSLVMFLGVIVFLPAAVDLLRSYFRNR